MGDYTDPPYWPVLKQLAVTIDGLDYFQVLNLAQDCTPADVKSAYYGQARSLHPDKFFQLPDQALRDSVNKIYKRVTESYNVLRDPVKRKAYTAAINGPDRANRLRYTEAAEAEHKQQQRADKEVCQTPKAKAVYLQASAKMSAGNWDGASKDLQTALMFEPANAKLKALKDEVDAKRKPKA